MFLNSENRACVDVADEEQVHEPTTEELMQEYRRTHAKSAVQIYATDTPDIYIFGYVHEHHLELKVY